MNDTTKPAEPDAALAKLKARARRLELEVIEAQAAVRIVEARLTEVRDVIDEIEASERRRSRKPRAEQTAEPQGEAA